AIDARVAGDPESHRGFILTGAGELLDGPAAIGYTVRGRRGEPSAHAYAFVVPMAGVGELVAHGYGRSPLLPPTAGRTPVNDSLLHAEVRAPDGTPLFTSPGHGQPGLVSQDTVAAEWGALQVEVTVRPDAAEKLVAGGMPPPRTPLFLAMIALVAIAGAAGLVLIRREGELARLRDDFVSGVSHELRTPLAQIRMFAELQGAGKLRTEEDRRRAVAVIDREARRLTHLVENVLQFTRLRRASEPVAGRSSLDLERALTEAVDGFRPLMESRDMRIRLESEPGLRAEMSSGSFRQILDNFLDNALKYGPPGQTVTVRAQSTERGARVTVDDEGPGVPRGERRRIWEAYRRLDRDTGGRQRGSGIGLAVVAALVEQHGGRAWVEASPTGGARFVAEVPGGTAPDRSAVRVEEVPA
ncbi:MAG: HAMP domain-containing sensor histidine kinase, partial [Gemmatimonadota bacterium]